MNERPKVSFVLIGYNSVPFIAEAVQGALAQDYCPLEIILSDDASTDATFDCMERAAESYHGPHRVVLNRNPVNLGVGGHVNRAVELASGEWIVLAAGDDISMPGRTRQLIDSVSSNVYSIYSNLDRIDANGNGLGRFVTGKNNNATSLEAAVAMKGVFLIGASHAFRVEQFRRFGPLDPRLHREDEAIAFRSLLLGDIAYLETPLVRYREHGANLCFARRDRRMTLREQRLLEVHRETGKVDTWLHALDVLLAEHGHGPPGRLVQARRILGRYRSVELDLRRELLTNPLSACRRVLSRGPERVGLMPLLRNAVHAATSPEQHRILLKWTGRLKTWAQKAPGR